MEASMLGAGHADESTRRPDTLPAFATANHLSRLAARRRRAWRVARHAAALLRRDFGATRVVVFGSLAHRGRFTPWSDIDLAAWGIPPDRYFAAVGLVTGLSPEFRLDLVDLASARPPVREAAEHKGVDL